MSAHLSGPADASAEAAAVTETDAAAAGDSRVAVLDTGRGDVSFFRLWDEAIRKYHVLQELEHLCERASWEHNDAARAQLQRHEAMVLAEAVHALRRLGEGEARKRGPSTPSRTSAPGPQEWMLQSRLTCGRQLRPW